MDRRGFLGLLFSLPFLGILKPKRDFIKVLGKKPIKRSGTEFIGELDTEPSGSNPVEVLYAGLYEEGKCITCVPKGKKWTITQVYFNPYNDDVIIFGYST